MTKKHVWWKSIFVGLVTLAIVLIDENWDFHNLTVVKDMSVLGSSIIYINPSHSDGRAMVIGLAIYEKQETLSYVCKNLNSDYETFSCIEVLPAKKSFCVVHTTERVLPKIYGVGKCMLHTILLKIK